MRQTSTIASVAVKKSALTRPVSRWTDLWKAPIHDFPIRDEILYQYQPLAAEAEVLEIGPGSGFTAFRMARQVRQMTLVDVAAPAIADLTEKLAELPNVSCLCADPARSREVDALEESFDLAFALDVFEYVPEPAACLQAIGRMLRPGGELFLTYPNVPPPVGDGVTYFSDAAEIETMLRDAGFSSFEIFTVKPRTYARALYQALHEWPLALYRRLRSGNREGRPQTYEETWAFRQRRKSLAFKAPLHLYWVLLGAAIRLGGRVFVAEPIQDGILGRQLVIRARR